MSVFYTRSYTLGAKDTSPSLPTVRTAASETRVTTQEPISTLGTPPKSWMPWALEQLHEIAALEPDWDSYGADPIAPRAIALATDLLYLVDEKLSRVAPEHSQPQVISPRADGGIQIEWGASPIEIAVHTDPSGALGYLYIDRQRDAPTYDEVQSASWDKVLQLIANVVFTVSR